jgi:hypothetical protein
VLLALPFGAGACGGGDEERDAEALLDRAFSRPVESADIEIDAELEVDGLPGFDEPVRIRATGPYVRAKDTLPKLDVDLEISGQGAGQTIQSGLVSTGKRVFLKFGGSFYEQPRAQIARTNRRLAREGDEGGGSLSDLGLDPSAWIVDASVEGEEEVGGVATEHVRGTLDVEAVVEDLNGLVKRSSDALGASAAQAQPLGRRQIERLSRVVDDPSFDVYVGKDDDVVRRISLRFDLDVPEKDRKDVGGITGASVRFAAQLDDVGGDQRVETPRESHPIADLTSQLGGLAGLAGLGGDGGGSATQSDSGAAPDAGAGSSGVEAFERYADCLERAAPDDDAAIERCAEILD